jgi:hypothetical protein
VDVTAPDGQRWQVRVRVAPRWRGLARKFGGWRRRRSGSGGGGGFDLPWIDGGDDFVAVILGIIALIVFGLLFWWVLLPLLLLVADAVLVVALMAVAIPARVLLGRPWTVEAVPVDGDTGRVTVDVVGWRRAREKRDELAARLASGLPAA